MKKSGMMDFKMKLPNPNKTPPRRVIVDSHGTADSADRALKIYDICSDIMFIREDGWILGTPSKFEKVAYETWAGSWTHFARNNDGPLKWKPIEEYESY